MKKLLLFTISILLLSCSNNGSNFINTDIISFSKNLEDIRNYYPLNKNNTWTYSLEQFQDDKPNTKFKEMTISVLESKDNYAIIKRFYPDSTVQPYLTKALLYDNRIELSRYELLINLLINDIKSMIGNLALNSIDILKTPLKKGNTWEGRIFTGGKEIITIEGNEIIEVPAGRFDALKVNHKIKYDNSMEDNLYYWYSKNIGTVKMYEEITLFLNNGQFIKLKSIGNLKSYKIRN
ncbi:MAG: hypothetical protein KatS3mg068_0951 [Candidatus Sericytochromatia bacterium]|nr:MAG: hypothetical protein KatS3mg068_0951 [Candidatus Sericytochromatia bacterium]